MPPLPEILQSYVNDAKKDSIFFFPHFPNTDLESLTNLPERILLIPTVDVGIGNPKWAHTIAHLVANDPELSKRYEADGNKWIFAEFADRQDDFAEKLGDFFLRRVHKKNALNPSPKYDSLEGYLKERGEIGLWNKVKAMAGTDLLFSSYANKIMDLAETGRPIDILATQDTILVELKNLLSFYKALGWKPKNRITIGFYNGDSIERPSLRNMKDNLNFVWLSSTYNGQHQYSKHLREYQGITGRQMLENLVGENIFVGTPLPHAEAGRRSHYFEKRWTDIEDIVGEYKEQTITKPNELLSSEIGISKQIKITILPSGSGMKLEESHAIIRSFADYIKKGVVVISWLGNEASLNATIIDECRRNHLPGRTTRAYDFAHNYGIQLVRIPGSDAKSKKRIISNSYSMIEDAHLIITPPNETPSIAEALGVPVFLVSGKGYNEKTNAEYLQNMCTAKIIKNPKMAAAQIIGSFVGFESPIFNFKRAYESQGYSDRYRQPLKSDGGYVINAAAIDFLKKQFS